ncbi:hypothetical protein H632_c3046p1 [Helicosporidium sp. ATCC 50920]|nr:hypothetical protein H632_c3046p1 [Helicosporidium sp. ATCC 50920]|eukprot:KDD72670.1 hypothetical protein H632_c3046p1 [Helicosporidium sp. ATCC 50920]
MYGIDKFRQCLGGHLTSRFKLAVPALARPQTRPDTGMASKKVILDEDEAVAIAGRAKTVAVLGIKTEYQASQPAYFVADYLHGRGIKIIPVPVFYPEATHILNAPVVRDLRAIREPIDILDVFRKPSDLPAHLEDILALRPPVVWLQSGIRNPEFERALLDAGVAVVADRCLKVDRAAWDRLSPQSSL